MDCVREDLYELVWSKLMNEVANDFGISDLASRSVAGGWPYRFQGVVTGLA